MKMGGWGVEGMGAIFCGIANAAERVFC